MRENGVRAEERVHYACDQMFDNAQISMTIKGVSCASPRVTSAKIGEKKSALILETHTHTHCQSNTPTRLPVYPLTRSLLTLNLKFTARQSYIRRRQQRNREPKRDTERGGVGGGKCICISRLVSGSGSECIRPGSLASSQVLQTGISIERYLHI